MTGRLAACSLLVAAAACSPPGPEFHGTTFVDDGSVEDFSLTDHHGEPFRLADHRGKIVLLFFGYGLGLMGQLPYTVLPFFAIGILLIQWLLSHYWLRRHAQGPLEIVWKRLAYVNRPGGQT